MSRLLLHLDTDASSSPVEPAADSPLGLVVAGAKRAGLTSRVESHRSRSVTNILQLRQLLGERFQNIHLGSEPALVKPSGFWPTGLPQFDRLLGGGLSKGAMTELVSAKLSSGSALVLLALLRQAQRANQWVGLVDAQDSFDPARLGDGAFNRLLWIRCRDAAQALKAADLLLRDGNLPLVLLDLRMNPAIELRKIPGPTWHRWQRLLEPVSTALLVLTPRRLVNGARAALEMTGRFSLDAIAHSEEELLPKLTMEVTRQRALQGEPAKRGLLAEAD